MRPNRTKKTPRQVLENLATQNLELSALAPHAIAVLVASGQVPPHPEECPTVPTPQGRTVCLRCNELWRAGEEKACAKARRVLITALTKDPE